MVKTYMSKIGVLLITFVLLFGITGCNLKTNKKFSNELNRLITILKENSFYYENEDKLLEGALRGAVDSLDDPYSTYFDEEEYKNFSNQLQATFSGVGISIYPNGNYPIITKVLKNSPAEGAGLKIGDTIISVDGHDLNGVLYQDIINLIKGPEGTERTFIIAREDISKPLDPIKMNLKTLHSETVLTHVIEKENQKIGYIKITTFAEPTFDEFKNAMSYLKTENIQSLMIDVRDNPGGYLHTVKSILDYFIDSDKPFMFQQYKDGTKVPGYLDDGKSFDEYKITILINEHSASASEIFAASMYDFKGYQLIGKTTFGKGTVQVTAFLNKDKTKAVKYTTSIWLTSTGAWIHKNGVKPTIEQELVNMNDLTFIEYTDAIEYDHVHQEIKDMQMLLSKLGYVTRTDGYFNNQTTLAVQEFQKDYLGVEKATGFVTSETIYYLNLALLDYINDYNNDEQYLKGISHLLES